MSKILAKPFDAAKKIFRSIFLGSPNLITSSDLNRQLEAFKFQMDYLDDKTGVMTDMSITSSLETTTLTASWTKGTIYTKGASFSFDAGSATANFPSSFTFLYLHLVSESQLVTYDDDFSHEIAGAKFEDGTAQPAANQMRYINEQLVLTTDANLENSLAILYKWEYADLIAYKELRRYPSYVPLKNGIFESRKINSFYPNTALPLGIDDSYDIAFSKLSNEFTKLSRYGMYVGSTVLSGDSKTCTATFSAIPDLKIGDIVRMSGSCTIKNESVSMGKTAIFTSGPIKITSLTSSITGGLLLLPCTPSDSSFETATVNNNFSAKDKQSYFACLSKHGFISFEQCYLEILNVRSV